MRFDLHIHTDKSYDSYSAIEHVIQCAMSRKLDGIAVTDHECFTKHNDCYYQSNRRLWIINGSEIATEVGDIIGLFLTDDLKSRNSYDLIEEIHDQNGIAVLAHPFKRRNHIYPDKLLEMLDAVEIVNGRWKNLNEIPNNPKVRHLLSNVKGRTAGSDSHFLFEIGGAHLTTAVISRQEDLKRLICEGEGVSACKQYSEWLDTASQGVKFLKRPSAKQFMRFTFHVLKNLGASAGSKP